MVREFQQVGSEGIKCSQYCRKRCSLTNSLGQNVCAALLAPAKGKGVVCVGTPTSDMRICATEKAVTTSADTKTV